MLYSMFAAEMSYHANNQINGPINTVPSWIGPAGIGKTAFHKKWAAENGYELIELIGPTLSPTDVVAMMPDGHGRMVPNFNSQIPWKSVVGDRKILFFLDEWHGTHPEVQKPFLKIVHERSLMGEPLGPNVVMSLAGNRLKDKAGVNQMNMALANRLTQYVFSWDKDSNDQYANYLAENFDVPMLPAFIMFSPLTDEHFNMALTTKQEDYTAWPTPRSVERVAARHQWCMNNNRRLEQWMIEGDVGKGWACEYLAFLTLADKLPDIEKIKVNPEGIKIPEKLNEQYAMTALIIRANSKENIGPFTKFMKRMDMGMRVLYMSYLQKNIELSNTKEFNELLGDKEIQAAMGITRK